ncbi:MAG: nucleoside hydrolase [Planctomycetota bacterium]|nr:nucleoside hydrolase [Planctomycetota bacterium]
MLRVEELAAIAALVGLAICACAAAGEPATPAPAGAAASPVPAILDTDIGDDIDDTWALSLLLKSPEVDLKLVIGDNGNAVYRARLIAKMLQAAGRTDVAVGIGLRPEDKGGRQAAWIQGYDLKSYPGKVHPDGIQALIDTIMNSPQPVTLIAIGPVQNIAAALAREPRIARKARFVGMHGSVRKGYGGKPTIEAEYNVKVDAKACRACLEAPWDATITPLDTCGLVHLRGEKYAAVRDSKDPVARALIENYRAWAAAGKQGDKADRESSTLFDTVAAYLGFSEALLKMEKLGIRVDDKGMTLIDPAAKVLNVATEWKDMPGFEDLLVKRLTGPTVPARK